MAAYLISFCFHSFNATMPNAFQNRVVYLILYGNAYCHMFIPYNARGGQLLSYILCEWLDLPYSVSAAFIGKTLNFHGRAIDANCHGPVGQI
eukprot:6072605-Pleurochrysis_carterae.AAC.1